MNIVKYYCKKNLKYDLINKFNYKAKNKIPNLTKIILNFGCQTTKLFELSSSLLALEVITNKRGVLTQTKKANLMLKIRKGNPVGCKIMLKNNEMFSFLEKNIISILPKLNYFSKLPTKTKIKNTTFSYEIRNLFVFPDLEKNYYIFNELKKLDVMIVTSSKNFKETKFLLKLVKLEYS